MKLISIQIKNYRSIDDVIIPISSCSDGSQTYGLIGINEAGKSSLLKAISLKDGVHVVTLKDFRPKTSRIEVIFNYDFEEGDVDEEVVNQLSNEIISDEILSEKKVLKMEGVTLLTYFDISNPALKNQEIIIHSDTSDVAVTTGASFDLVLKLSHKVIFWTAESRYLISEPVSLASFAANPDTISIPLKNCFALAGIIETEILSKINKLPSDSTEREDLEKTLGENVTEHIKNVWPNHPIEITFNYDSGVINFHVKDVGVKEKAKTADQRSDGFKQFISFLLTISAQSKHGKLTNSILLLDEPETHLHPQAQQFLLKELIKISSDPKTNNLVFFATHSNYMIDKEDLSRNYKVIKEDNNKSKVDKFDSTMSSYSGVNYEVFDVPTSDYHNELYGFLQEEEEIFTEKEFEKFLESKGIKVKEDYIKIKKDGSEEKYKVTLPTRIRNQIHHPENTKNIKYKDSDLRESIEYLKKIKNGK